MVPAFLILVFLTPAPLSISCTLPAYKQRTADIPPLSLSPRPQRTPCISTSPMYTWHPGRQYHKGIRKKGVDDLHILSKIKLQISRTSVLITLLITLRLSAENKNPETLYLSAFPGFESPGDERIELPPKVLETPIIPFDQSPTVSLATT